MLPRCEIVYNRLKILHRQFLKRATNERAKKFGEIKVFNLSCIKLNFHEQSVGLRALRSLFHFQFFKN
ncbi:hypothetical protein NEOC84_000975|nr:hypothetical protein [Neochlamydia sp. AcF84]